MTGTKQLEMKLHELSDQVAHLKHELAVVKKLIENPVYGELCTDCQGGKK